MIAFEKSSPKATVRRRSPANAKSISNAVLPKSGSYIPKRTAPWYTAHLANAAKRRPFAAICCRAWKFCLPISSEPQPVWPPDAEVNDRPPMNADKRG